MPNPYIHAPAHFAEGGDPLTAWRASNNGIYIPPAIKGVSYKYYADDFPGLSVSPFVAANNGGTGAISAIIAGDFGDHQGVCQLYPGATANAYARVTFPGVVNPRPLATYIVQTLVNFRDFVSFFEVNQYFCGFTSFPGAVIGSSTLDYYIGFLFCSNTSHNLLTYTANAGPIVNQNDTGIAVVGNTWVQLTVIWTYGQALFFVNGTLIDRRTIGDPSVVTTLAPSNPNGLLPAAFQNTVGTTVSRSLYVDTMEFVLDTGIANRFLMDSI